MGTYRDIASSIKKVTSDKTSAYDTTATVQRIEGDTVWVHIPGGTNETPAMFTVDCKEGDTVMVRVGNGKAWLTGNATAPPTDNTVANEAKKSAKVAQDIAIKAQNAASDTNDFFYHDRDGTHMTTDEYGSESGPNLLADNLGIYIRNNAEDLASFLIDKIELKKSGAGRLSIDTEETYFSGPDGVGYLEMNTTQTCINGPQNAGSLDIEPDGTRLYSPTGMESLNIDASGTNIYSPDGSTSLSIDTEGTYLSCPSEAGRLAISSGGILLSGPNDRLGLYMDAEATAICDPNGHESFRIDAQETYLTGPLDTGGLHMDTNATSLTGPLRADNIFYEGQLNMDENSTSIFGPGEDAGGMSMRKDGTLLYGDIKNSQYPTIEFLNSNSTDTEYIGFFRPGFNGSVTLGTTSQRFYRLHSTKAESVDSDERLKKDIKPINLEGFFNNLRPVQYRLKKSDEKIHFGFIAQDVAKAMKECGMDEQGYDFISDGREMGEEESGYYSLAYSEFIALNTSMIQKQQKEIDSLKTEIKELKNEIDVLKEGRI